MQGNDTAYKKIIGEQTFNDMKELFAAPSDQPPRASEHQEPGKRAGRKRKAT